jgi:hypothetical protein
MATRSGTATDDPPAEDPATVSVALLRAVRRDEPTDEYQSAIADYDLDALAAALDTEARRKAFWCNLYNAYAQIILEDEASLYGESRRRFFGREAIPVAGREVSLDDVEHGLLRRSRFAWGLGYLTNPFPGAFERRFRVDALDPRIHFALNCGAESCPPIAAYTPGGIDDELDLATESYLQGEVSYEPDGGFLGRGVVRVPRLMLWYRGDFGGKSGILALLREHDLVPVDARPRLKHRGYDWTLASRAFRDPFET